MKTINGDLIKLAKERKFDIIIHGCNCMCTMGSGIAKSIKDNFPIAYEVDCKTIKGDKNKLGKFSYTKYGDLLIINAYTQYNYSYNKLEVDYGAIRLCMREIKDTVYTYHKRIGIPKIGAGRGGGNWDIIKQIIDEELDEEDVTLVEYSGIDTMYVKNIKK